MGATLRADSPDPTAGRDRSIGPSAAVSSYGGSSLVETIGLGDPASSVASLTVTWPVSRTTQTFRDLKPDRLIEITEGNDSPAPIDQPRCPCPRMAYLRASAVTLCAAGTAAAHWGGLTGRTPAHRERDGSPAIEANRGHPLYPVARVRLARLLAA